MSRKTPEWIGKTDDTRPPPRVRLRVFEAHGGRCHITGVKITAAHKWELDHIIALINGGENRESNLAPALTTAHRKKTSEDVAMKSKDRRVRQKHLGIKSKKSSFQTSREGPWKGKIGGGVVRRSETQ